MKKFTILFWLIILSFFGLVVFQNQDYFLAKQGLFINLHFKQYHMPEIYNVFLYLIVFVSGLLISYIFSILELIKANKVLKQFSARISSDTEKITALENEIDSLKSPPSGMKPNTIEISE